jgi:hypothetical protein
LQRPARRVPPADAAPARRRNAFIVLVVASVLLAGGYVAWAALRAQAPATASVPDDGPPRVVLGEGEAPDLDAPRLVFQNVADGQEDGRASLVPLDDPSRPRIVSGLECLRVHYAGDRGLCLVAEVGLVTTYHAVLFGADFAESSRLSLSGLPSRARVSPDGRYGATTVFVFGHSYADGDFSTQTTIIDMAASTVLADLEDFTVTGGDGREIRSPDFNFWGVTFVPDDSNRFYATLRTGDQTYLVEGDIEARSMTVLRENVECPSLSPDGTRIAFKKQTGAGWRLSVLDLENGRETALADERIVDDQVEWLSDEEILYGYVDDIWKVRADGSGEPRLFLPKALSPAVVTTSTSAWGRR